MPSWHSILVAGEHFKLLITTLFGDWYAEYIRLTLAEVDNENNYCRIELVTYWQNNFQPSFDVIFIGVL